MPFGDGLRFVGGGVQRFAPLATSDTGTASWTDLHAQGNWAPGDTRYFQVFYRDNNGPCGSGFNLTSGLQITFLMD